MIRNNDVATAVVVGACALLVAATVVENNREAARVPAMHRVDTPNCTDPDIAVDDGFMGCPDNYRRGMDDA